MAIHDDGERAGDNRFPKRQRLPDEDDEGSNDSSSEEEVEEEEEDEGDEEEEENVDVTGSRMATMDNVITEGQSGSLVSSSSTCKSPLQSVKLQSTDILDCPTCCEPLRRPIYQCNNGHLACSSCCTKLKNRCSFCRSHIGDIRCRAMEKIIEGTIVPCSNAIYGCMLTTIYGNQSSHEKLCPFVRCSCPLPNCNYIGSYTDLKSHAHTAHTLDEDNFLPFVFNSRVIFGLDLGKKKMAIFHEQKEGDLFVVQAFKGLNGVYVSVSCIAPNTPGICNLSCSLAKLNEFGTLRQGLIVKNIQKVREEERPKDGFMLIPSYMLNNEHWKMQISIGRGYKYVHI